MALPPPPNTTLEFAYAWRQWLYEVFKSISSIFASLVVIDDRLDALESDRWDDLRFPATAINPPGAASDPGRDTTDGTLVFNSSKTELVYAEAQMPHAWKDGSDVRPHVHWCKTTAASGNVGWELEYKHAPIGQVRDAAWTSLGIISTSAITDNGLAEEHLITPFGAMTMTGYGDSHTMFFRLSRIGGDASDTYGADAKLFEFDIHYQSDSRGSINEYPII